MEASLLPAKGVVKNSMTRALYSRDMRELGCICLAGSEFSHRLAT